MTTAGPGAFPEGSKAWWEERYKAREYLYGKEPSAFVVENLKYLRKGKLLDLGAGEGRNAAYLGGKGFEVEAMDFSETACARATRLARDCGVENKVKVVQKDIDMFLLPLMTYDTILICNYKPALRFFKDINRGLTQNGIIVIDVFSTDQLKADQGPKPEFFECYKHNEVLQNLTNVHITFYQERETEPGQRRVQCIARKTTLVG